ncbi:MAG: LCP family protein [Candidatus Magasanikbacteria bacterium]
MQENNKIDFLQKEKRRKQKDSKWKRILGLSLVVISLVAIITGVSWSALPSSADTPEEINDKSLEPKEPNDFIQQLGSVVNQKDKNKIQDKERINVLLLGMGGPGHDGPYLTDTIIIGSIKPSTGEVAMVSVPRDLRVKIPDLGYRKINFVNSYGEQKKENWGAAYTTKLIEKKFNLDITYYARIDFKAFKELVNEMNGINVQVEQSFVDNQYPGKGNKYQTIKFEEGVQKMNGSRALKYARSRHGTNDQNSDFSRARRQQKVILAAKRKALSYETLTDPNKIYNMLKSLNEHITTNMDLADIVSMIDLAEKINLKDIKTLVLDNGRNGLLTSKTINGVYYLIPKSGNFEKINKKIKNVFDLDSANLVKNKNNLAPKEIEKKKENIEIKNGTWKAGLAARTKTELKQKALSVHKIGNTSEKPINKSGIYKIGEAKQDTIKKIKNQLNIPIKDQMRPGIDISTSTDILVILGKNYKE